MPETDPLLSNSARFYFLNKEQSGSSFKGDSTTAVEAPPPGATEEEFAPRPVGKHVRKSSDVMAHHPSSQYANGSGGSGGFWAAMFGQKQPSSQRPYGEVGTLLKQRKAPIKIEPKVFFANERTFLAWMHLSVILAGASIAILAFAQDQNPVSQLYGVVLLPVAIAFIVYSMYQYTRRARMIRHRHPGPYEDVVGPVVLGVMLMVSITAQFALKLYDMNTP